ncbi:MAG: alanine racemase [Verrucomicrobiales bacterium]|nr:alanine racemase [Verrucomicrobiales bacterium]
MKEYPVVKDPDSISSPGLWVDKAALQRNLAQMISDIGGESHIDRLRPHVKTHKMTEVIKLQVTAGILKCKAATPAEAKMAAEGGARDILIAHQLVGPKIAQVARLMVDFPEVTFSTVTDDVSAFSSLASQLEGIGIWIDVDCGMHRSGIEFGAGLDKLRDKIESTDGVEFRGLHVYDGHLHDPSLESRRADALAIIESVREYLASRKGTTVVGGGTPTFGIWAGETEWECSPGTTVFWDCGYGENYPDLEYEVAAGLITRVISKPGVNQICLDLGHKSISAEMELSRRVFFPQITDYKLVGQSEEHLVLEVPDASEFEVGDVFTAIPRHVCPTVALHAYASILENGIPTGEIWKVTSRDRL